VTVDFLSPSITLTPTPIYYFHPERVDFLSFVLKLDPFNLSARLSV